MTSYAQYQPPPMASMPQDFGNMYASYNNWEDRQFMPTTTSADPNNFMAYNNSNETYVQQHFHDPCVFGIDSMEHHDIHNDPSAKVGYSFDYQQPPVLSSNSDSGASVQSAMSSHHGSPSALGQQANDWHSFNVPSIVQQQDSMIPTSGFDFGNIPIDKGCVDPSLINAAYPEVPAMHSPHPAYPLVPSPVPSTISVRSPRSSMGKMQTSPHLHTPSWQPYPAAPAYPGSRRQSVSSTHSRHSNNSSTSESSKGLCPYPTCGRHFKDLKAHMLTHQNERPEKCPIPACEYHIKGFARKYDKNRHTLTHYKGTMVCGFCPGSGSSAEKSFNRADVFKRHLTSVHGVEQTPPNARRKSPAGASKRPSYANSGVRDAPGMCSTCGVMFANAQDFYEHLDDCVLRVVQQAEPSEAINDKLLRSVADDAAVQATLKRHNLPASVDYKPASYDEDFDDEDDDATAEDDDEDFDDANDATYGSRRARNAPSHHTTTNKRSRKPSSSTATANNQSPTPTRPRKLPKQGLTHSAHGVPLRGPATASKKRNPRASYPLSWASPAASMTMKKRVLCVFDGPRRLWKDDMMLDCAAHEVRIPLREERDAQGRVRERRWVTDLDVLTLARAEGVLGATEEEKGPWVRGEGDV